jgi:hypothetical protein
MLSGAELNQLLMPTKFGAVPCKAATSNGAVGSRAISPPTPAPTAPIRQSAMMDADVASGRIIIFRLLVAIG